MRIGHLRDSLLQRAAPQLVCNANTDLVIEGFPRSSNSFTIWMLNLLQGQGPRLKIAHHTHSVDNFRLAQAFEVPAAVLVRQPEDAILSFMIYSGAEVAVASNRWLQFYEETLEVLDAPLVLPFETVTQDFNQVVERLNAMAGFQVPLSQDLEADTKAAYATARTRAEEVHQGRLTQKIAIPSEDRERIKVDMRLDVQNHLAGRPEIGALYDKVMSLA